jgi:hypothetical protein
MCWLNPKVQGNYVFGLGVTLAVFGVILFAMGIRMSAQQYWIEPLLSMDYSGFMFNLDSTLKAMLYVFGLFTIALGALSYVVCKLRKKHCTVIYLLFLPFVLVICFTIAVPSIMLMSVTEPQVAQFCENARSF